MEKHQHQQKDDRTNRKRGRGFSPRRLGISVVAICIGLLSFAQVYMFHQHQYHHDNHNHNHNHSDLPVEFYQMSKQTKRAKKESQLFRSRRRQQQQQQHQDSNGFLPKQHKHQKGGNGNGNGNGNRMEYNDDCEENDDALGITSGVLRKFLKMEKTEKLRNRKEFQSRIDRYVAERLSETNSKSASTTIHAHEHEQAHEQAHEHESGGANNADPSKIFVDLDSDPNPAAAAGSDNDNDGPWMVLHIGPPKTATTTIQCGLEKYSLRLAKTDGYHYLGGGCGFPKKEYIMPNGEAVVLRRHLLMALHNIGRERLQRKSKQRQRQQQQQQPNGNGNGNDCGVPSDPTATEDEQLELLQTERSLGNFLARVSRLRKKHRSVILSGEQFGSQLSHRHPVMDRATSMLTASPDGAGFAPEKVRIILAYRHFVDWLPSFHYQQFLILDSVMDHEWVLHRVGQRKSRRVKPFLEYADQYLTNWENHQTDVQKYLREELANGTNTNTNTDTGSAPVLPSVLPKDRQSIHPSWWLYTVWSSYFPLPNQVQVYDMHSPMNSNRPDEDMVTDFICHMLPSAKNTCQRLKDEADGAITAGIAAKSANTNPVVVAATTTAAAAAAAGNHLDRLDHFDYLDYDYENPRLHSTFSLLHPNRTEERLNLGSNTGSKSGSNANVNANVNANANTDSDNKSESGSGSDNNGKQQQQQQMNIRPSSAHHAIRIVEELLLRQEGDGGGGFLPFPDDDYDARYFDTEVVAPTDPDSINGYTKPMLVQRASELLEAHGIYSSSTSSSSSKSSSKQNNATTVLSDSSSYEERFSDRYFDCITPELEERLLNASRIFLDLMYKHTPMLSLATAATYGTGTGTVVTGTKTTTTTTTKPERGLDFDNGRDAAYADGRDGHADGHESHGGHGGGGGEDWEKILEEEKGKRWAQAKDEHERLFEKNKKKGKYCDINPDKVFRNNPEVYEELVAMRYKPSFRQFLWNELSEAQKGFAKQLGFVKDTWQGRKNALVMLTDWKELSPEQKAGAFRLGWNQDAWDTIAFRLREFLEKQGT